MWLNIIRRGLGFSTRELGFEQIPAVGQVSVTSPAVMKPLAYLNKGKKYKDQIKPFNFLNACHVSPLGYPLGTDPEKFHLIAPYEIDSRKWLKKEWINQYTGEIFRITTSGPHGNRRTARVKTYGDVLEEYEFHPESKCADSGGNPCEKSTIGLLQRRHIQANAIRYIGKESNLLEDVESGLVHSSQNVYTEYIDPRRDEWTTKIWPVLKKPKLGILVRECHGRVSRRALIDLRAGRSRPHRRNRELLVAILSKLGLL